MSRVWGYFAIGRWSIYGAGSVVLHSALYATERHNAAGMGALGYSAAVGI